MVHTLVPEMFWKEHGLDKGGILEHRIPICTGSFGTLYFVDFTAGTIVNTRLRNLVEIQVLSCSVENAWLHLDVGNIAKLNPKVLREAHLWLSSCKCLLPVLFSWTPLSHVSSRAASLP